MTVIKLQSADGARAEIHSHGAHLTSWVPAGGEEQLFLSTKSDLASGAAIRGGVPIIFPQFSDQGALPRHGFARTAEWQVVRAGQDEHGTAQAVFELRENIARLMIWPQVFHLEYTVTLSGQDLRLDMVVHNNGDTAFNFTAALHSYFAVRELQQTRVFGLQGLNYRDTAQNKSHATQTESALHIQEECDRIYGAITGPIRMKQAHQELVIRQAGFNDTVIWNPGADKCAKLADMEAEGYQHMLCVEAAQIFRPVVLAPGQRWSGAQMMSLNPPSA